jgi:hypothetical protein
LRKELEDRMKKIKNRLHPSHEQKRKIKGETE